MSRESLAPKLDPYVSSSLLQKAIRRGAAELTTWALQQFYRHRGNAVWRRLATIAFEDIGVANPVLLARVVEAASAQEELDCATEIALDMAASTKCRSADHLFSCIAAETDGEVKAPKLPLSKLIETAADRSRNLRERAAALAIPMDRYGKGDARQLSRRLTALEPFLAAKGGALVQLTIRASLIIKHPFPFLLPLIGASLDEAGDAASVREHAEPEYTSPRGVPSYAFDKYTRVGKVAASRMATACAEMREVLANHVMPERHPAVVQMVAFHVDASHVDRSLSWPEAVELAKRGVEADMLLSGCPPGGAWEVIGAVSNNLDCLNELRESLVSGGSKR